MKGVIFDLDGVLCSTDHFHYLAWQELARTLHLPFDAAFNNRLRGVSRSESLELLLAQGAIHYTPEEKERMAQEKNERYRALLEQLTPSDASPNARELLRRLRAAGLRLAVGSSSKNARYILERLELQAAFDAVADGTQIQRSKPDPEVFLLAARLLALSPADCAVVEDAAAGIEAAAAGGFFPVAMGSAFGHLLAKASIAALSELPAVLADS